MVVKRGARTSENGTPPYHHGWQGDSLQDQPSTHTMLLFYAFLSNCQHGKIIVMVWEGTTYSDGVGGDYLIVMVWEGTT